MKICIILGTRPEIIKMSPIIRECQKQKLNYFILHTNQHYSENLDRIFFDELELPKPKYNLEGGFYETAFKSTYDGLLQISRAILLLNGYRPDD